MQVPCYFFRADRRGGYGAGSYGGGDFGGRVAPRMAPPIDPEKQRKSIFCK